MFSANQTPSPHMPSTPTRSNSHPYAIATSSSAILSRSNSTNTKLTHHTYSPQPLPQLSPHTSHRHDYRSHRHSKSLSSVSFRPPSLPRPPASGDELPRRSTHSTLTDIELMSESDSECGDEALQVTFNRDPKHWTSHELSTYMMSQGLPLLADFLHTQNVTGQEFLCFSPTNDLPASVKTLAARDLMDLYDHSRKLRLISLRGHNYGRHACRTRSDVGIPVSAGDISNSVTNSKVKGMVRAFEKRGFTIRPRERSDSTSSGGSFTFPHSTVVPSLKDLGGYLADEDNFTSASEPDSDIEPVTREPSSGSLDNNILLPSPIIDVASESPESNVLGAKEPAIISSSFDGREEPSIETLLLQDESPSMDLNRMNKSWGAQAWEEVVGATARRIPLNKGNVDEFGFQRPICIPIKDQLSAVPNNHEEFTPNYVNNAHTFPKHSNCATPSVSAQELPQESVEELRTRLALLESRIKDLEQSQKSDTKLDLSSPIEPAYVKDDEASLEMDLPQYLLMAGVGVCAIIGQAVLRKFSMRG